MTRPATERRYRPASTAPVEPGRWRDASSAVEMPLDVLVVPAGVTALARCAGLPMHPFIPLSPEIVMPDLNPQPLPPRSGVRIYVTREVAYDLDKMTRVTANVLNKLGCGGCHSGRFLDFQMIEDYVINPATLEPTEVVGAKV